MKKIKDNEVLYAHFDRIMALTRTDGWKEIKVGRLYKSEELLKLSKDRGYIHNSKYTFNLGGH